MKKFIVLSLICFLVQNTAQAKDYAQQYLKEMKKSQKYSATSNYFEDSVSKQAESKPEKLKDPKLVKIGNYKEISNADYKAKIAKDNAKYKEVSKFLTSRKVDDYNVQAYGEDFYKIYRIAEKIIRANKLDFINWRLVVEVDSSFNAYTSETNSIAIHTGAIDTLINNEDALALLIGHEIAHSMLGHKARKQEIFVKLDKIQRICSQEVYMINYRKFAAESRKMEFTADTEGAILAARAGYDLDKAKETLAYINTLGNANDGLSTHPKPEDRIKSLAENRKYFLEEEWAKQGKYNIYNSNVLTCQKSSSRNSLTILRGELSGPEAYYSLESPDQMYLRYGYKSYLNGEYKDAVKYLKKSIDENKGNFVAHLYASYANEYLYKQTGKDKFLKLAKEYAYSAKNLAPDNEFVKEQILAL